MNDADRRVWRLAGRPAPDVPESLPPRPACADADPDTFFPEKGSSGVPALTICLTLCSQLEPCARWALAEDTFAAVGAGGVVGGLTDRQRQSVRNGRTTAAASHAANRLRIGAAA